MIISGLGHAGMFIETQDVTILCDPMRNAAFSGSWYSFPLNDRVDWEAVAHPDVLYISHRHDDHFDRHFLADHVNKSTKVLIARYPTSELREELSALGFGDIHEVDHGETVVLGETRVRIVPQRSPGDGPLGDSSLIVRDQTACLVNQNDAHPLDFNDLLALGRVDGYFLQFSGASWWPMVYDLPIAARQTFAAKKREAQNLRALHYIDRVEARHVFPFAGPPCFLDENLFKWNGTGLDGDSIFTDQSEILAHLAAHRPDVRSHLFVPGTRIELTRADCTLSQTAFEPSELESVFEDKWRYLRESARSSRTPRKQQGQAVRRGASGTGASPSLGESLIRWWQEVVDAAPSLVAKIAGNARYTAGDVDVHLDFAGGRVEPYKNQKVRYWFESDPVDVRAMVERREPDWSNGVFLTLRFTAGRIGKFDPYLQWFFKSLSAERAAYVERWIAEQPEGGPDVEIGDWSVQRRCPHLGADLRTHGTLDGSVLTCNVHGWQFDLESGRCLRSNGFDISAKRSSDRMPRR